MSNERILLVEDEVSLLDLYKELLTSKGYIVDTANNGQKAMHLMTNGGYDLVLLDIRMPQMDGLEVLKNLHAKSLSNKNKKVIMLSNLDSPQTLTVAKKYGAQGQLLKSSYTPDEFLKEVASLVK